MSIHPDIKKAIEIIDQRIESLRNIREKLAQEFGMDDVVKPASPPPPTDVQLTLVNNTEAKTSKDKIAEYLRMHGPAHRSEIIAGTGIPEGTVAYALNDPNRFHRTERGWLAVSLPDREVKSSALPTSSGENKTELARQFFREQGVHGGTAGELKRYLESKGAGDNEKFAYSAVARLKNQQEIEHRGDRYYATEKLLPTATQTFIQ